jgi:NTP pyrophosphatase (non-canonical NTP hydrolase)
LLATVCATIPITREISRAASPLHQTLEELADELFRCRIHQITLCIEGSAALPIITSG